MSILDGLLNALRPTGGQHTPEELYPGTDIEIEWEESTPAKPIEIVWPECFNLFPKQETPKQPEVKLEQPLPQAPLRSERLQRIVDEDANRMFRVTSFMQFPQERTSPVQESDIIDAEYHDVEVDTSGIYALTDGGMWENGRGESFYDAGCDPSVTCGY